eukprot:COSAG02_NODE_35106_length_473_cov_24.951872_1_plen_20_part_10
MKARPMALVAAGLCGGLMQA